MTLNFPKVMAAIIAPLLTIGSVAIASDALYPDAAPDDAVFVRVMAQESGEAPSSFQFGGRTLSIPTDAHNTYLAVSAATLEGVEPGSFHTVVSALNGPAHVISEPARNSASKVHLFLVNASAEPVRLVLSGRDAEVIAPVASGESNSRAVNPVSATLAIERLSDSAILGTFDVTLARGQNQTFLVNGEKATRVANRFGPVIE